MTFLEIMDRRIEEKKFTNYHAPPPPWVISIVIYLTLFQLSGPGHGDFANDADFRSGNFKKRIDPFIIWVTDKTCALVDIECKNK